MNAIPHDFRPLAARLQRIDAARRAIYSRGFAHGVLITLAGLALLVLWVCAGGAA